MRIWISQNKFIPVLILIVEFLSSIKLCSGQFKSTKEIHKCCESQFEFNGESCVENDSLERKLFPEYLFGKYRLTRSEHDWHETDYVYVPLESLRLTEYGYFLHERTYVPPSRYCLNSVGPTSVEVFISPQSSLNQSKSPVINKCCKMDYSYDVGRRKCFRSKTPWGRLKQNSSGRQDPYVTNIIPRCENLLNFTNIKFWDPPVRFDLERSESGKINLRYESPDGVFLRGIWRTLEENYCIDQLQNNGLTNQNMTGIANSEGPEIVIYCIDEIVRPVFFAIVLGCMWIFTSALLVVAAVVNVFLLQRNVHGYVLFGYLLSSAILNVVAGVFIIIADDQRIGCYFIDFAQKFFYLSTLCWMTMVNFDLWWDFRKLEPNARKSMKRLPCYIFVAWAIPVLVITVCWIVGTHQRTNQDLTHCILYDYGLIFYSSGPVVILIAFNLLLFIRTVILIRGLRKSTQKVLRHNRRQRESFKLFSKLFLMTGPIWILRVILLALQVKGIYLSWYGVLLEGIFIIPDIAFFFIVVCHRRVLDKLRKQLPWLKGVLCCCRPHSIQSPRNEFSSGRSSPKMKILNGSVRGESYGSEANLGVGLYVISSPVEAAGSFV